MLARQVTYGAALHWDSSYYIGIARNLLAGEGFVGFDNGFQTIYPPLYPLLLAVASLGVADPLAVAGLLNAAIFGLTIFAIGRYLHRRLRERPVLLATWACLATMLSIPVAGQAAFALSEPAFILLATLALICADRFMAEAKLATLIWMAVFSALAWQARYMGIALLLAGTLALVVQPGQGLGKRLKHVAIYLSIAAAPMAVWILRNYLLIGAPTGKQVPVDYSLPALLGEIGRSLWAWTHFDLALEQEPWLAFVLPTGAVLAVLGCLFAVRRRPRPTRPAPFDWRPAAVFGGFAAAYFLLLLAAMLLGYAPDGVQARYLTPLYVPLLLVAAFALDWWLGPRREKTRERSARLPSLWKDTPGTSLIVGTSLAFWLALSAMLNGRDIESINRAGVAESLNPLLATSEILQYVRQHLAGEQIFSNALVLTHLVTDQSSYLRNRYLTVAKTTNVTPGAYAVWLKWHHVNRQEQQTPFQAATVLQWSKLDLVVELPEGSIWHRPRRSDEYLAYFHNEVPAVDEPFLAGLNNAKCRRATGRNPWRWEVGGVGREGSAWRQVASWPGKSFMYSPVAADVGLRLRASVDCVDSAGERITVTTPQSLPVNPFVSLADMATILLQPALSGEPAIRSVFDVHLRDRKLIYVKEFCTPSDLERRFFLHVDPISKDDLPVWRRQHGFDNHDFDFSERGILAGSQCLGAYPLPAYPIASIKTGQKAPAGSVLWEASISIDEY